ncbi:MAG: ribonuclease HI [Gammaproteobacteria bacterium]|jgi:ribonuclease HI
MGSKLAKKYYVVWQGRKTGVFADWVSCKQQVDKFPGARFKSFSSRAEAEVAYGKPGTVATVSSARANTVARAGARPASRAKSNNAVKTYSIAEVEALQADTKIFTDGGCEPNPGQAGSGIAVYREQKPDQLWYGLYNPAGTNNTAELNALHQGMLMAEQETSVGRSVAIFCDSKYSIQCVTQWASSWQKKGWKKPGGEIKNLQLIQEMFALYQTLSSEVQVLHVNGHVGVQGNELADRMTILAIETREPAFVRYQRDLDVAAILRMRTG